MTEKSGRPLPQFSEDDVIDFMVTEAVVYRAAADQAKADKEAERKAWRKGHKGLAAGKGGRMG